MDSRLVGQPALAVTELLVVKEVNWSGHWFGGQDRRR
jgi:hypothetical protein